MPYAAIADLVKRYPGPVRRVGRGLLPHGTPGGEARVLTRAGFAGPERHVVPGGHTLVRTTDDVVARTSTMSFSAPHLFGPHGEAFETDLAACSAAVSPPDRFAERLPSTAVFVRRRHRP